MNLAKVIEVTCESNKSFEDAIANGVKTADKDRSQYQKRLGRGTEGACG